MRIGLVGIGTISVKGIIEVSTVGTVLQPIIVKLINNIIDSLDTFFITC